MEILIKRFTGCESWDLGRHGVILVEKEADIEPLWQLLCEQDDWWESAKSVIKVAPKMVDSQRDLDRMCEPPFRTEIYHPKELKAKIPFIMYQK